METLFSVLPSPSLCHKSVQGTFFSPALSLNSSVSWDWAASYKSLSSPWQGRGKALRASGQVGSGISYGGSCFELVESNRAESFVKWFFCEVRTPVVRAMLRNIPSPKQAFHCPALVRLVCCFSQAFRWSWRMSAGPLERTAVLVRHSFGQQYSLILFPKPLLGIQPLRPLLVPIHTVAGGFELGDL